MEAIPFSVLVVAVVVALAGYILAKSLRMPSTYQRNQEKRAVVRRQRARKSACGEEAAGP